MENDCWLLGQTYSTITHFVQLVLAWFMPIAVHQIKMRQFIMNSYVRHAAYDAIIRLEDSQIGAGMTTVQIYDAKQNRVVTVEKIEKSDRLDKPINLSGWFPERPYFSATNYLRELEVYNTALDKAQQELGRYDLHSR